MTMSLPYPRGALPSAADALLTFSPTERAVLAHYRMLSLLGVHLKLQDLLDRTPEGASAHWLVQSFAEHGIAVRAVDAPLERLRALRTPALLPLRDGSAAVLTRVGRFRATLEDGWGQTSRLPLRTLTDRATGVALEQQLGVGQARGLTRALLRVLSGERRLVAEALVSSLLLSVAGLVVPWLSGMAVDRALPDGATGLLSLLALAALAVSLQQAWLGYLRERTLLALDLRVQATALREVFARLLARPYAEVSNLTVGEQTQAMESADRATQASADLTFAPALDVTILLAYFVGLSFVSPYAGLAAALLSLLSLGVATLFALQSARVERERVAKGSRARGLLYELISGVMAIKAAGAARACVARWLGLLVDERELGVRRERLDLGGSCVLLVAQQAALVGVIALAGKAVLDGALSLGGLAMAWMYVDGASAATSRLNQALARYAGLTPHLSGLRTLLDRALPPRSQLAPMPSPNEEHAIVLEDVWFRYGPDQPWVLEGYSLRVERGRVLKLSGVSGKGKTTVLRLIAGLLQPERGTVRVFGRLPAQRCDQIAYLPQDAFLLEGSILANLMLMSGTAPEGLAPAVRATGLSEWVDTLPMRLETVLPPGGGNLSGGQRQWIALTAAVASKRSIVLLDEPTSHLDPQRKERLVLEQLFAGRTVVVVSHEQ